MHDEPTQSFEVTADGHHLRADKALSEHLDELSRSQVQRLFAAGRVWFGDDVLSKSAKVNTGDVISYSIPEPVPLELCPVDIPLNVIFEDEDIIVVNKAPGMVVHPGAGTGEDTLVHALLHHCQGELSGIGGVERPGIVHRLDKETSGVIISAKSDRGYQGLAQAFAERSLEKHYTALVCNAPRLLAGVIDAPIGRHSMQRTRMTIRDDGRESKTTWKLRESIGTRFGWLNLKLHTGRTHQIRVHCAHIGHILCGDRTYGYRPRQNDKVVIPRVMLHAARLELDHPVTGERLTLVADDPADFLDTAAALHAAYGKKA
jgi:23S rRNA pseudouridine1911/1915/1917 synthase|tara:strand:+ start:685 stop:1635 length:951 start_codon:yes stop_codon:yes gene_type:complete